MLIVFGLSPALATWNARPSEWVIGPSGSEKLGELAGVSRRLASCQRRGLLMSWTNNPSCAFDYDGRLWLVRIITEDGRLSSGQIQC